MRYLDSLREGMRISEIYLCKSKQIALTKNGKEYGNLVLQDKTGTVDAKIWDLGNPGIGNFEQLDYVYVDADVTMFMGNNQLNIRRIRKADEGEYVPADYLPVSTKDIGQMYQELLALIGTVKNPYLRKLLDSYFVEDPKFAKAFQFHSAAKSVHHGFVGGLLEHTLSVTKMCDYFAKAYPTLNRDLLLTAAMFHDIGKTVELSTFPENDYTDDGQLLGHIIIGTEMVGERIRTIPGFPDRLAAELKHCILAHHGELEYGSPRSRH
jgi:3'-5' exoribonuclease